ncbi:MAG: TetR/AcrR family transcriptional regulator [Parvibaculales bacterium]
MNQEAQIESIDGRRKRSARSRAAIITATLTLLENGNLSPTAKQIAEEAGVGLRSFFRHFEDMDALLEAVDQQARQHYEHLFLLPKPDGDIEARLSDYIDVLSNAFERLKRPMLSTQFQMWQSKALQHNWARNQRRLRKHLEKWVPELHALPDTKREAVHAAASFDIWHRLRHHQSLSISEARGAMLALMLGVLNNQS